MTEQHPLMKALYEVGNEVVDGKTNFERIAAVILEKALTGDDWALTVCSKPMQSAGAGTSTASEVGAIFDAFRLRVLLRLYPKTGARMHIIDPHGHQMGFLELTQEHVDNRPAILRGEYKVK